MVACVVDPCKSARARATALGLPVVESPSAVLDDPSITGVFVATPPASHVTLAVDALMAGKHVLVEKPLATSVAECRRLADAERASGRKVLVGHLMLYHPALTKLRELCRSGALGRLRYLYATRVNLGTVRATENAWWSLAPHDLSMMLELVGGLPTSVAARGAAYVREGVEDVVFANLEFPGGVLASLHVSWLDPHKRRQLTVVGEERMVTFDDMEPSDKVRVFEVEGGPRTDFASFAELVALRQGDIAIPRLEPVESLQAELSHFLAVVRGDAEPRTGLASGLDVVRVLEAGQRSLMLGGSSVLLVEG
jgi:predicted dehydrogenase